ncbi:S41 family peptidase [Sphingobacteriaceae bacterium WQ 2009]|uniref:S41 family peptidase n=1 Tax=Rhinopithecimicrobium faecis TaxID=2820698 RepID=A0A8T4H7V8_9SPHI|nr:S41 family peptidase [Sphingobacteriaceae bacterium WQ 2009]
MQNNTKRNFFVAATYAGVLYVGLLLGQNYADEQGPNQGGSLIPIGLTDNSVKLQYLINLLSTNYVDSLSLDTIQDEAIQHILQRLDPFSNYMKPQEARQQYESLEGSFEGIGMEYFKIRDTLMVVGLLSNGPAEKAGFKVGDRLIRLAGKHVANARVSDKEVEQLMRGKRGSSIEIFIERNGQAFPYPFRVTRDHVNISSLDAVYMLPNGTGYVKVRKFGVRTGAEFKNALVNLKKQGAQRLILDLRNNPGGYLHASIDLLSHFFPKETLLVYTEGANELRQNYFSNEGAVFKDGSIAVLINENTASAAEIVAGAIQDLDRGVIIGRRSYGKGLVQEQFDFADGSSINLTIARYFTPLGRGIQRKYTRSTYNKDIFRSKFDLWSLDTTFTNAERYVSQKGKVVYGGGGVLPDITLPIDSNELNTRYREIYHSQLIENFVYDRFTRKSPAYSIENFLSGYHVPEKEYAFFLSYLAKNGYVLSAEEAENLRALIHLDMEALVARFYFGREAYFKVRNRNDRYINSALTQFNPIANSRN